MKTTKPALASTVGIYKEQPVAPSLRGVFSCTWVHQMPEGGIPPIVVKPDGTIDLQWINGRFRVAGPDKDPRTEILPDGSTVIGFRFKPAAASAWLKTPAKEILGSRISLEDLWGRKAGELAANVRNHASLSEMIASIETALAEYEFDDALIDGKMHAAFRLVQSGPPPGAALLPWLEQSLEMNERTLRRRFDQSFGYGPKLLDRILRYQRFLKLARTSRRSTAVLATEAGYSDQSHLIRESQCLTGTTPLQIQTR